MPFRNDDERAVAFAAYKALQRMLKDEGDLPPGYCEDFGGAQVTITLPRGTVVEREWGTNGDGTIHKKAVQNLYGYATWGLMISRLRQFNQWPSIRRAILEAVAEVNRNPSKNLRGEIIKTYPEVADEIKQIEAELVVPMRIEKTPRVCKETELPPTVDIRWK
jgi:hypothetical protein